MQYFVHYNGWNKKWDEWVDTTRLLKYNDHNVAYQHSLLQQKEAASRAGKQSSNRQSKPGGRSDKSGGAGSKRKSTAIAVDDDTVHDDSGAVVQNEVKIKIPANLKKQLIVDWENVTRKQCIVPLPHPIKTVSQILDEFAASKVGKGDGRSNTIQLICHTWHRRHHPVHHTLTGGAVIGIGNESISREVSIGLRNYFDRALGTILLYRYERVQYEEYVEQHPDVQMSNVYGVEHLLRLFVKLPALLQATKLDGKELKILCDKVQDILKYLDARIAGQHHLFVKQYQPTDKIYQDKYAQI